MCTYHLLADVVHDSHDGILVPPLRILDRLDLTAHNDDLTSWNELAAAVCGSEVLGNARRRNVAIEGLGHAVNHLCALASIERSWWARGEHKVAVEVDDKCVGRGSEEGPALSGDTENVGAWLLNKLFGVSGMDNWDVETAPLVDADAVADGLSSNRKHSRVVADKYDAASWRQGGLNNAYDVRNGEAREKRPHGEVLESRRRGRELVAQRVVLHVDSDEIIESRRWETEDTRHLLGVEEVRRLVPVDPHSAKVVTEQIVEWVSREEGKTIGDPVCLVGRIVEVRLGPLAKVPYSLGTLLIGPRPDAERNTVQSMG